MNPKTNEPTRTYRSSYHATLDQCIDYILDTESGKAEGVDELRAILSSVSDDIKAALGNQRKRKVTIVKEATP